MANQHNKEMKNILRRVIIFLAFCSLLLGAFSFIRPVHVAAQDVCDGPQCNWVNCDYQEYRCTGLGLYRSCQWITIPKLCCRIPQAGGGSCTCCFEGGCYFNCDGSGGGGGGGGSVSCGDGTCNGSETCGTCAADCGACPTPPPVEYDPVGNHDAATCNTISGWACDQNNYSQALTIHFYMNAPYDSGGTFIGSTTANIAREAAVGAQCGGNVSHGFSFATPINVKDGFAHAIYAYAIDIPSGIPGPLLSSSPHSVTCGTCGDLNCTGTETCSTCATDCGPCPPVCGDGTCNGTETCQTCVGDCPPSSTARARAVVVPSNTTTCAQVNGSSNYAATNITLVPGGGSKSASGGSYATWAGICDDTYTTSEDLPTDYAPILACWTQTAPPTQGTGYSADVPPGSTVTWNLGYVAGVAWAQAQGGDVYAATTLRSYIPSGATPRQFVTDGTGGSPGTITYGTSYDFSSDVGSTGQSYSSSTGWLVNEAYTATDYYQLLYNRFGSPAATHTGATTFNSKPASGTYMVNGNLTINSADWTVTNGQSIVVFVNGNLTVNRRINLTGTGFVAFVVNGNITISPNVGVAPSSSTSVLEGIYITTPTGTFNSGTSTNVGTERLVAEGIFVAGFFTLGRDLDSTASNISTSAELFIYNPQLLVTMPDAMRDLPVTWQEVAP